MENVESLTDEEIEKLQNQYDNYINKLEQTKSNLTKIDVQKGLDTKTAFNVQEKVDGILVKINNSINAARMSKDRLKKVKAERVLKSALGIIESNSSYDINGDEKVTLADAQEYLRNSCK